MNIHKLNNLEEINLNKIYKSNMYIIFEIVINKRYKLKNN